MASGGSVGLAAAALLLLLSSLGLDFIKCNSVPRFGTVGGNVTLSPSTAVNFEEIIWKKGKNKVIEWSLELQVNSYPPFKERAHLDPKSGDLVIFNLTSSDEDEYEIESVNLISSLKFNLTVLDPLPPPTLHCALMNETIEVLCEVSADYSRHREQLRYTWHKDSEPGVPSPHEPAVLRLNKSGDLPQNVHCVVKNPESNRTASMELSSCLPGDDSRKRDGLVGVPFVGIIFALGIWKYASKTE